MPKLVEFRTSISGFNKNDVNKYIADSTAEFVRERQEAQSKIEELASELENQRETNMGAVSENESLKQKIAELEAELARRNEALESAEQELSALRGKASEYEGENAALKGNVAELESECGRLRAENAELPELREKAERYAAMSSELGEMIISAKKTSCDIIAGAEADAERMRDETDARMQAIRTDAENKAGNALEMVSELLHSMAEETFGEMMTYASEAQFTVGAMFEELKRKSSEINDRIRYINASSNANLREKLAALPTTVDSQPAKLGNGKSDGGDK